MAARDAARCGRAGWWWAPFASGCAVGALMMYATFEFGIGCNASGARHLSAQAVAPLAVGAGRESAAKFGSGSVPRGSQGSAFAAGNAKAGSSASGTGDKYAPLNKLRAGDKYAPLNKLRQAGNAGQTQGVAGGVPAAAAAASQQQGSTTPGQARTSVWTSPGPPNKVSDEFEMPPPSEGGLDDAERMFLGKKVAHVRRVLEWGMGESTKIMAHSGVPFVRSIDSHPKWVANVSASVPKSWEVLQADIGPVQEWGVPEGFASASAEAKKRWERYMALGVEGQEPFDLYFVDGRFRVACALTALIHGMGNGARTRDHFRVMVHDWSNEPAERGYRVLLKVADIVDGSSPHSPIPERRQNLIVLRRKEGVTDEDILALYERYKADQNRRR